jgi:hypothetical protein
MHQSRQAHQTVLTDLIAPIVDTHSDPLHLQPLDPDMVIVKAPRPILASLNKPAN